uniref:RRM domain-containing protein n=1 Tax=Strigamia maritima TaxID=126957 RepID=T1J6P2_STRMM
MDDATEKTLWCGNLSPNVTEDLLFELFLQAGPLEKVTLPKDKDGKIRSYAFIMFKHSISVAYATDLLNGISLLGRPLRLKPRSISTDSPNSSTNYEHTNDSHDQRGNMRRPERVHRTNSFSESTNSRNVEIWSNNFPPPPLLPDPRDFVLPNLNLVHRMPGLGQKMVIRGNRNVFHPYVSPSRHYPYWQ